MGINIFMLDPMAVSISWWSRPLKVVVYVVFIFLTTSTTALWWCASWWGFFSSQGGRGDPFFGLAWLLHWRRSSWGCCLRLRWRQLIRWRWCWMISIWWSSRRWGSSVIVVHILILVVIAFKLLLLLTMMWVVLMGVQGTTRMISTALDHSPLIYESGRRGEATQIQITKNPKGSGRVWCRR